MKQLLPVLALFAAAAAPIVSAAATIDASLIPDGTYNAKVKAVNGAKSITVTLDNGSDTTLTTVSKDFSSVKPGASIKFSIVKGDVKVFVVTS